MRTRDFLKLPLPVWVECRFVIGNPTVTVLLLRVKSDSNAIVGYCHETGEVVRVNSDEVLHTLGPLKSIPKKLEKKPLTPGQRRGIKKRAETKRKKEAGYSSLAPFSELVNPTSQANYRKGREEVEAKA